MMFGIEPSAIRKRFSGIEAGLLDNFFKEQMAAVKRCPAPHAVEPPALNRTQHLCRELAVRTLDGSACGMLITLPGSITCVDMPASTEAAPTIPSPASADDGGEDFPKQRISSCLTPRQRQVMGLVLDGHPNKNIALDLCISQRTVENHRAAIMRRTGATSLPALARIAIGASRDADHR